MDTISDMLTRIRNASKRRHDEVIVPFSNIKHGIAKVLKKEGYIESIELMEKDKKKDIKLKLSYNGDDEKFEKIKRISKPGLRIYKGYKEIFPVVSGYGIMIISTSNGVMTDKEARKQKMGGEILCKIY